MLNTHMNPLANLKVHMASELFLCLIKMLKKPPAVFQEGRDLRKRGASASKAVAIAYNRWAKRASALCDKYGDYAKECARLRQELLNMHRKGMRANLSQWKLEQLRRSRSVRAFNLCVLTHCREDVVDLAKSRIAVLEYLIEVMKARLAAHVDDKRGDAFTRKGMLAFRNRINHLQVADEWSNADLMDFLDSLVFNYMEL